MPTQTPELLKNIQAAFAASPELVTQLSACKSQDEMAAQLSKALSFPVSAADLAALEQQSKADMTDEQLEAVAGGGTNGIIFSIFSFGFACAVGSIVAENAEKGKCKKVLDKKVGT